MRIRPGLPPHPPHPPRSPFQCLAHRQYCNRGKPRTTTGPRAAASDASRLAAGDSFSPRAAASRTIAVALTASRPRWLSQGDRWHWWWPSGKRFRASAGFGTADTRERAIRAGDGIRAPVDEPPAQQPLTERGRSSGDSHISHRAVRDRQTRRPDGRSDMKGVSATSACPHLCSQSSARPNSFHWPGVGGARPPPNLADVSRPVRESWSIPSSRAPASARGAAVRTPLGRAARVLSHQHWAMTAGLLVETSRPLRLIGRPGPCKLSNSGVLGDREPVCLAIGSGSVKTSEPETDCPPRQAEPSDVLRVARAAGRDG
jgi:hypothetical protein